MPTLPPPNSPPVISPPTYQSVARAINRCKSSSSACPLDQLSVIILKNCPILRTLLHRLIVQCWSTKVVPSIWKRGVTILIYKKGDTADPANFRPITLQPVWYKIFASVYATAMSDFLTKHNYIEQNQQKGFWKGIDGVSEHTEMLAHLLKTAKREQRSITIALLDLKNAFGEVHHNLIAAALRFHYVPAQFVELFKSTYENNFIVVAMDQKITKPIRVQRGVLQGDPSSPLLFNLCFNTLMLTLQQPTYQKLGFSWGTRQNRQQRAWLQFADDAAIAGADNASAQGLLNVFQAWCAWSGMTIRLDKCVTFGMQKRNNVFAQIMPNLSVTEGQIPAVPVNGEFTYLGRRFSFDTKNESAKLALEQKLRQLLQITSQLKIRTQTKLKILSSYIHSQLLFEIKLYDFPLTWVEQTLDALCLRFMRDWLEMPVSACVQEVSTIPKMLTGLGISSFKHLAQKLSLTKRNSLRLSASSDIREIWAISFSEHIATDELLVSHDSITSSTKALKSEQQHTAVNHLFGLQLQGAVPKCVVETVERKNIEIWSATLDYLPTHLFNFARKALLQVLPTAANLKRWSRVQDASCPLCACGKSQTNKHVLSNCGSLTALHRYTVRHNDVLSLLINWFKSNLAADQLLYADLSEPNILPVCDLFKSIRPDAAISDNKSIHTLELTVCHETNIIASRDYKRNKYRNISDCGSSLAGNRKIVPHTIEISTLGFISNISDFTKAVHIPQLPNSLKHSIVSTVLQRSFGIYCNRNNAAMDAV